MERIQGYEGSGKRFYIYHLSAYKLIPCIYSIYLIYPDGGTDYSSLTLECYVTLISNAAQPSFVFQLECRHRAGKAEDVLAHLDASHAICHTRHKDRSHHLRQAGPLLHE